MWQFHFTWQSVEILNVLNILALKQVFWKMKNFFKRLEYLFLVEGTTTECAKLPFKATLSKWSYHKNRILLLTALLFFKFNSNLTLMISWFNLLITQISTFKLFVSKIWGCVSPVSILKSSQRKRMLSSSKVFMSIDVEVSPVLK